MGENTFKQEKYGESEVCCRSALAVRKPSWGHMHVDIAAILHVLSLALFEQSEILDAEEVSETCQEVHKRLAGASRHDVAAVLSTFDEIREQKGSFR